jgi:RNA polymerase sigma-70 factor, ECF subfamily
MKFAESSDNSYIPPQLMKEKQWVREVRENGDKEAFEKIFKSYYKRLHGFAYSFVEQAENAEDIVQTVFLRIWTQRENWNPPGTVKQYLFTAVKNEALNNLRHEKIIIDAEEEVIRSFKEFQRENEFSENIDKEEIRIKIENGINELPPRCRQIFLLNRRSGLTYTEIAEYLGVSINTVNTQMGRALKSLRDYLSDYLPALVVTGISRLFF